MPIQAPSWTDFLNCPICCNEFAAIQRLPISLGCGHTICKLCLTTIYNRQCPFDQTLIVNDIENIPINYALLQLVGNGNGCAVGGTNKTATFKESSELSDLCHNIPTSVQNLEPDDYKCYKLGKQCIEDLALHLKSFLNNGTLLTRPMQRKLVTLVNCQLMDEEGRVRALRAARSLGERTVTELILQHQNPQQLSSNLWAAVRTRGCQFLGPAMQEEVLKLVLLALEEGSALSRKVLVMFVVQRLEPHFPQASKTSIGHVVQLLYRASCFKVSKREADSSLMQLKEEFRTYDALRREHDAQIVQIATEAGLRIAPEQWSSLLYGDILHKSHMQSIIDKLQTPSSFAQSVQELVMALQRTNDPAKLSNLHNHLQYLASIDPCVDVAPWSEVSKALDAVRQAVVGLVQFLQHHGVRKSQDSLGSGAASTNIKYKISLCRDLNVRRVCPRGSSCTFAHSKEELERYRAPNRGKSMKPTLSCLPVINNPKNALPIGEENNGQLLPLSPMRYMQPNIAACRNFVESNCAIPPPHNLSPVAGHGPPIMHSHHSVVPRQSSPLNGMLGQPVNRYELRFNFSNPMTPTRREFRGQPQQRNPPNFPVNNNLLNNARPLGGKNFCNILPVDGYGNQTDYFGNDANTMNNNDQKLSSKLGHAGHGNLWEQSYIQQPPVIGPSTKNPPNRALSIANTTSDTSFLEKKPPNNLNIDIDLDINKPMGEISIQDTAADAYLFRSNNNNNNINHNTLLFWNSTNKSLAEMNNAKHIFQESNFVRSDSILDDDATTFDMPTGSSMNSSRFGPICPKRTQSNWINWLPDSNSQNSTEFGNDERTTSSDLTYSNFITNQENNLPTNSLQIFNFNNVHLTDDSLKSPNTMENNDNINKTKNSGACDNGLFWHSKVNAGNGSHLNSSRNYWTTNSNDGTNTTTTTTTILTIPPMSSNNERLKHHQLLARKPQLMSEDSFEGGIDTGMMIELEKELVDIVENPDDSGIKLD